MGINKGLEESKGEMINSPVPFVSVIIPVRNDPVRLRMCLQVLEAQTYPKNCYEVIVVDNGSSESIEPVVALCPQAKAAYEARPGSYAARNTGISLAQGDILAFTDSDCIPAADWIEKGVEKLLGVPNCGLIGGGVKLFYKNAEHPTVIELYDRMVYLDQKTYIEKLNFGATANLFTFKQVFDRVGGFESKLVSGGDYVWGQRVAAAGYGLVYADDVCVDHPARYYMAQLLEKEKRVAQGTAGLKNRKRNVLPLTWSYVSILDHLPALPPVFKVMRLEHATLIQKVLVLGVWLMTRYIKVRENIRAHWK